MKRFSVIVPEHDSAEWMRKGLDSIVSQTFKDYELIIVCDSCKDDSTYNIAKEYTSIVEKTNSKNCGIARNKGLDMATGEYILFMDDDDWWLHEYAFDQLDKYLTDEDVLCFGFIWKWRGYTSPVRPKGTYWPAVWNKCWKRTAIGDTRFLNVHPEDTPWHKTMMNKKLNVKSWDMPLYYYNYWREGSISYRTGKDLRFHK